MSKDDNRRCTDPQQGLKVLSYDLLEDEERQQIDAHMEECETCRDLRDQVFGDEGAFQELEYRAFKLSQRQHVPASAWIARRLQDLWIPFLVVVVLASAIGIWLARREPEPPPVRFLQLKTMRAATLDTTSTVLVPRLEPGIETIIVETDQDAFLMVYEAGDEVLRRLIPGAGRQMPALTAKRVREVAMPPVKYAHSKILLVVVPANAPTEADRWDVAILRHFGGGDGILVVSGHHWPEGAKPTMLWVK
jgi:hypothetical protein